MRDLFSSEKIGVEIEFLFNPTPYSLALYRKKYKTFDKEGIRDKFKRELKEDWWIEKVYSDDLSDELVTLPIEFISHLKAPYQKYFDKIMQSGLYEMLSSYVEVGIHHNFDIVNREIIKNILLISVELRDIIYVLSNRKGKSGNNADIHYLLGDFYYQADTEELKKKVIGLFDTTSEDNPLLICGLAIHSNRIELRWYGSTSEATIFFLQLQLSMAIYSYAKLQLPITREELFAYIKRQKTLSALSNKLKHFS